MQASITKNPSKKKRKLLIRCLGQDNLSSSLWCLVITIDGQKFRGRTEIDLFYSSLLSYCFNLDYIQLTNKIMDSEHKVQHQHNQQPPQPSHDQQQSLFSSSNMSSIKKVGTIVSRKRCITQANHHTHLANKNDNLLPTPKQMSQAASYRARSYKAGNSRTGGSDFGVEDKSISGLSGSRMNGHSRSKSYQLQRQQLENQLQELIQRRHKLQQLKENKLKLRVKLNQLEVELKQIKRDQIKQKLKDTQNRPNKLSNIKKLRNPKLKPIQISMPKQTKTEADKPPPATKTNKAPHNESSDEQQVVNYFYEAQLHHKCLNCQHFNIKLEDVRIPTQLKNDYNL